MISMESKDSGIGVQSRLDGEMEVCADCLTALEDGQCPSCIGPMPARASAPGGSFAEIIPSGRDFRKILRRVQLGKTGRKFKTLGEGAKFQLKVPVRIFNGEPVINYDNAELAPILDRRTRAYKLMKKAGVDLGAPQTQRNASKWLRRFSVSTNVLRRGTDGLSRTPSTRIAYPSVESDALPNDRSETALSAWDTRRLSSRVYSDAPFSDGAEWYQRFITLLDPEHKGCFNGFNGPYTDPAWTDYIIGVIASWGKGSGYEVIHDHGSRVRFDLTWARQGTSQVVIEHENDGENKQSPIEREIEKLVHYSQAPLRVLITYFRNGSFPEGVSRLKDSIENELNKVRKYDFELLAMAAPYDVADPQEYVAYLFRPSFILELVLPRY